MTPPPEAEIHCLESDGLLRLSIAWNRGDPGGHKSLGCMSGMVREELGDVYRGYGRPDSGTKPELEKRVFRTCIT